MKLVKLCLTGLLIIRAASALQAQPAPLPFYTHQQYDASIQTPDQVLGFELGSRAVRVHEMTVYLNYLDQNSARARLLTIGHSYEGRPLTILMVGREDRIQDLDKIQAERARFADPRLTSQTEAAAMAAALPAVAWMMYNVHGNELSGSDAALQLAYQLTAGQDAETRSILDNVIVAIDATQNPDGRERTLAAVSQWRGLTPSMDVQSMEIRGAWPGGRANHYLFDLNRDWFVGSQIETQHKVRAMARWNPQLVVDAHEMGSYSTYYFNPPREPISHHIPSQIRAWWDVYARQQAKDFDAYGWSYYTRDSFDEWYPGYGSSWAFGLGSVAILYEQARTMGQTIKRPEGKMLTYRETVHHQFVSSMANLKTTAEHREKLLTDCYAIRAQAMKAGPHKPDAFVLLEGRNPSRARTLVSTLMNQGIEVERLAQKTTVTQAVTIWSGTPATVTVPKGSYVISMHQPMALLALSILEFDVRLSQKLVQDERKSLESGKGTRMYEVGAWSMPLAYGVEALALTGKNRLVTDKVADDAPSGSLPGEASGYGYLLPYEDDSAVHALNMMLNEGIMLRCAGKPFTLNATEYSRGALLVRRHENDSDLDDKLRKVAAATGVRFNPAATALTEKGVNLGNESFELLAAPRIAMLTGSGVSSTQFGAIWHYLDRQYGMRVALLDINTIGRTDLRKYNVLLIPSAGGLKGLAGKEGMAKMQDWVNDGGTLIAMADAAAALTDSTLKFSKVRLRRNALKNLSAYSAELRWETDAGKSTPDSLTLWGEAPLKPKASVKNKESQPNPAALDRAHRLYMPRGAFMRVDVKPEHWLGFGVRSALPALCYTDKVFMSKRPVETAVRFGKETGLRLSGLVWPEARARWAQSAYLTRERLGSGQVILFSNDPIFRGYTHGTGRMLLNAILLGPGLGARAAVEF